MKLQKFLPLLAAAALCAVAVAAQAAGVDVHHALAHALPALASPDSQIGAAALGFGLSGITTYVQKGDTLDLTPAADVAAGQGYLFGAALFGVAAAPVTNATQGEFICEGVVTIAKTSALAIAVGDRLFWDATNKCVNKTTTAQQQVGIAVEVAANPSATVKMLLESALPVAT